MGSFVDRGRPFRALWVSNLGHRRHAVRSISSKTNKDERRKREEDGPKEKGKGR